LILKGLHTILSSFYHSEGRASPGGEIEIQGTVFLPLDFALDSGQGPDIIAASREVLKWIMNWHSGGLEF
jgi:hypothetical protein